MRRLELRVFGTVQDMNFRMSALRKAKQLGLVGEAMNEPNGSVFVIAEGPEEKLDQLRVWAEEGPNASHITDVHEHWDEATESYTEFRVSG